MQAIDRDILPRMKSCMVGNSSGLRGLLCLVRVIVNKSKLPCGLAVQLARNVSRLANMEEIKASLQYWL